MILFLVSVVIQITLFNLLSMQGLYIHIPFCEQKCSYCNFQVIARDQCNTTPLTTLMTQYTDVLCQEIEQKLSTWTKLRTIYLGGGTPLLLGYKWISKILDTIFQYIDPSFLEEISIETNPYPWKEIYNFIQLITKRYHWHWRMRRSMGIQSLNTKILRSTKRPCTFAGIQEFLRDIVSYKQYHQNICLNLDLIAFWLFREQNWKQQLRSDTQREFFTTMIASGWIDSFSLYMLDLWPGSDRYHTNVSWNKQKQHWHPSSSANYFGTDEEILQEFLTIKDVLLSNGYQRYEISNFSLSGKNSLHNRIYRWLWNRYGVGTSAVQYLHGIRTTNTSNIFQYLKGKYSEQTETLSPDEQMRERAMLGLRTQEGVLINKNKKTNPSSFRPCVDPNICFVSDREEKITKRTEHGYMIYQDNILRLSDEGMDIYNSLASDLLTL